MTQPPDKAKRNPSVDVVPRLTEEEIKACRLLINTACDREWHNMACCRDLSSIKARRLLGALTSAYAELDAWESSARESEALRRQLAEKEREIERLNDKLASYIEAVHEESTTGRLRQIIEQKDAEIERLTKQLQLANLDQLTAESQNSALESLLSSYQKFKKEGEK